MPSQPIPEEERALQIVLEGGFTFYGLISALPELPVPLSGWTYQEVVGDQHRTVRCQSRGVLPHGHDAVVLQALLNLHEQSFLPPGEVICTAEALHRATSLLSPALRLTDRQLYDSLKRLMGAMLTVTRRQGRRGGTAHFCFLDLLELDTREGAGGFALEVVGAHLSRRILRLRHLVTPDHSTAPVAEMLELEP